MPKKLSLFLVVFLLSGVWLYGDLIGDESWGFKFNSPEGWLYQQDSEGVALGHNTIAGLIIVMPHMSANLQAVKEEMQMGLDEGMIRLFLAGGLTKITDGIMAGNYQGTFNGQQVKARVIGTVSPDGGGAYIFALSLPMEYNDELDSAAMSIAKSVQYIKSDSGSLMTHFAGSWASFSSNTESYLTLFANGEYTENYIASYSGEFTDPSSGTQSGNWGAAGSESERGRWSVKGNKRSGIIYLKALDGSEYRIAYEVLVENGVTYWTNYYFNGNFYMKNPK